MLFVLVVSSLFISTFGSYLKWTVLLEGYPMTSEQHWNGVALSASGDTIAAVQSYGNVVFSLNSGKSWTNADTSSVHTVDNWKSVSIGGNGKVVAAVSQATGCAGGGIKCIGDIIYSSNGGQVFLPISPPIFKFGNTWNKIAVDRSTGSMIVVAGFNFVIVSTDKGETWTRSNLPVIGEFVALALDSQGDTVFVAMDNQLFSSDNKGVNFIPVNIGLAIAGSITGIACDGACENVCFTESSGGIYCRSKAKNWFKCDAPVSNWSDIACSVSGIICLATTGAYDDSYDTSGSVYSTSDGGVSWTPSMISSPNQKHNLVSVAVSDVGDKVCVVDYGRKTVYLGTWAPSTPYFADIVVVVVFFMIVAYFVYLLSQPPVTPAPITPAPVTPTSFTPDTPPSVSPITQVGQNDQYRPLRDNSGMDNIGNRAETVGISLLEPYRDSDIDETLLGLTSIAPEYLRPAFIKHKKFTNQSLLVKSFSVSGDNGHWVCYFYLNDKSIYRIEMVACSPAPVQIQTLRQHRAKLGNYSVLSNIIIVPMITEWSNEKVAVEPVIVKDQLPWEKVALHFLLDKSVLQDYSVISNDVQQPVQRVLTKLGLHIPSLSANYSGGASKSSGAFSVITGSTVTKIFGRFGEQPPLYQLG